MSSVLSLLQNVPRPGWRDGLDIFFVTFLAFRIVRLIRGTRAWTVLMGIIAFAIALWLSQALGFRALSFLLERAAMIGPVALLVVFLPEVRQWVMELGTTTFWRGQLLAGNGEVTAVLEEIVRAVEHLSQRKMGALVVVEGRVGLDDIASTGRRMDSLVSAEIVETIFYPGSALHDGAAVIRNNRIVAAGCLLPMPASPPRSPSGTAHTRHAAALELAQQTDALVLVVSEETGSLSLASDRHLIKGLTSDQLRKRLLERLGAADSSNRFHLFRR